MGSAVVMLVALVGVAAPAASRRQVVVPLATSVSRTGVGPVVITSTGTANAVDTSASGVFRAVGAVRDTGTFTVRRNLTTLHDLWRLSGKHGKVTVDLFREATWTIVAGTGGYAHLHGKGTAKTINLGIRFREVFTGAVAH
jgi:hypothetical protein